jgi:NADH-quinone oxidoreductase subunit J
VFIFQMAGMILLTAMVGAIVLTLRHRPGVKRQDVAKQTARTPANAITNTRPVVGAGVDTGVGVGTDRRIEG